MIPLEEHERWTKFYEDEVKCTRCRRSTREEVGWRCRFHESLHKALLFLDTLNPGEIRELNAYLRRNKR